MKDDQNLSRMLLAVISPNSRQRSCFEVPAKGQKHHKRATVDIILLCADVGSFVRFGMQHYLGDAPVQDKSRYV